MKYHVIASLLLVAILVAVTVLLEPSEAPIHRPAVTNTDDASLKSFRIE